MQNLPPDRRENMPNPPGYRDEAMRKRQTRVERAAEMCAKKKYSTAGMQIMAEEMFLLAAAWQRRECVRAAKEEFKYEKFRSPQTERGKLRRSYADRAIAAIKRSGKGK
jgi:hypothetical protein